MKQAIVVQGPSSYVNNIKSSYANHDLIFSTWVGSEQFYNSSDNVVFNTPPETSICSNFLYQQKSTMAGLLRAKELGYTHVLKMRSDIVSTNKDIFDLFKNDCINFLCWHYHEVYPKCKGYLVDYFMYGPVDELIALWNISDIFCNVPEILLTNSFINKSTNRPNFILYDLGENYDLYWIKHNILLSSYKATLFEDPYKKYDFGNTVEHLDGKYLNFLLGA